MNLVSLDWVCKYLPGLVPSVSPFATIKSFDVEELIVGKVFFRVELGPGSQASLLFEVVEHTTNDLLIGLGSMKKLNIFIDGKRSQIELGNLIVEMGANKVVSSKQGFACMAANSDGNKYICPEVSISEPVPFTNQLLAHMISTWRSEARFIQQQIRENNIANTVHITVDSSYNKDKSDVGHSNLGAVIITVESIDEIYLNQTHLAVNCSTRAESLGIAYMTKLFDNHSI